MNKFELVRENSLIDMLEKGYEIIHSYQQTWTNTQRLNGHVLNNSFDIDNFPVTQTETVFVMKATPAAQTLFGKKDEN